MQVSSYIFSKTYNWVINWPTLSTYHHIFHQNFVDDKFVKFFKFRKGHFYQKCSDSTTFVVFLPHWTVKWPTLSTYLQHFCWNNVDDKFFKSFYLRKIHLYQKCQGSTTFDVVLSPLGGESPTLSTYLHLFCQILRMKNLSNLFISERDIFTRNAKNQPLLLLSSPHWVVKWPTLSTCLYLSMRTCSEDKGIELKLLCVSRFQNPKEFLFELIQLKVYIIEQVRWFQTYLIDFIWSIYTAIKLHLHSVTK